VHQRCTPICHPASTTHWVISLARPNEQVDDDHGTTDEPAQLHGAARRVGPVRTSANDATRAAGIIVGGLCGIVPVAIGFGALATRLVSADAAFTVALSVTTTAALISGLAAEPVLYRLARNQRPDNVTAVDPQGRSTADGDVAPGE
jgi:hypothetical protein